MFARAVLKQQLLILFDLSYIVLSCLTIYGSVFLLNEGLDRVELLTLSKTRNLR